MKRFIRWAVGTLSAASLLGGLAAAGPGQAQAVPQIAPLAAVAPGDPPACTTPPPVVTFPFLHCYTPSDIDAAYGVDQVHAAGLLGQGQTIVLVDSYGSPTAQQDLNTFSDAFGLPRTTVDIEFPDGAPTYNTTRLNGAEVTWAFETSLDLQWAHAIAPLAKLVLVAANPAETQGVQGFPSLFRGEEWAIQHFPGSVMSQSFGTAEQAFQGSSLFSQVSRFDQVYRDAVAAHVTVFAAAGDAGTANPDKQGNIFPFPTVWWPASDPLVTSAGGTWLQYGWRWDPAISTSDYHRCLAVNPPLSCRSLILHFTAAPGRSEAVWKEDWAGFATGGGRSVIYPTPAFQSGISPGILQGRRGLPDLSWSAADDGGALIFTSFPGLPAAWRVAAGTSAAAPQLAALTALASQKARKPVGYLNPLLYQLPPRDFTDIAPETFGTGAGLTTLADNSLFGSGIAGTPTTSGWDLTTGLGSPKAMNYVTDLAALVDSQ